MALHQDFQCHLLRCANFYRLFLDIGEFEFYILEHLTFYLLEGLTFYLLEGLGFLSVGRFGSLYIGDFIFWRDWFFTHHLPRHPFAAGIGFQPPCTGHISCSCHIHTLLGNRKITAGHLEAAGFFSPCFRINTRRANLWSWAQPSKSLGNPGQLGQEHAMSLFLLLLPSIWLPKTNGFWKPQFFCSSNSILSLFCSRQAACKGSCQGKGCNNPRKAPCGEA